MAGGIASGKVVCSSAFHIPPILVFPASHTPAGRGLIAAFKHVKDSCDKGERMLFFISIESSTRVMGLNRSSMIFVYYGELVSGTDYLGISMGRGF